MEKILNSPSIKSKYCKNHRLKKSLRSYKIILNINESDINSEKDFIYARDKIMIDQ